MTRLLVPAACMAIAFGISVTFCTSWHNRWREPVPADCKLALAVAVGLLSHFIAAHLVR